MKNTYLHCWDKLMIIILLFPKVISTVKTNSSITVSNVPRLFLKCELVWCANSLVDMRSVGLNPSLLKGSSKPRKISRNLSNSLLQMTSECLYQLLSLSLSEFYICCFVTRHETIISSPSPGRSLSICHTHREWLGEYSSLIFLPLFNNCYLSLWNDKIMTLES